MEYPLKETEKLVMEMDRTWLFIILARKTIAVNEEMTRVEIVKHFLRTFYLGNLITFLYKLLNFPKFTRLLIHLCIISRWGYRPPSEPLLPP